MKKTQQGSLNLTWNKCRFWNANDSVVKLMVSIKSGVSL